MPFVADPICSIQGKKLNAHHHPASQALGGDEWCLHSCRGDVMDPTGGFHHPVGPETLSGNCVSLQRVAKVMV